MNGLNLLSDLSGGSASFTQYAKVAKIFIGIFLAINLFHAIIGNISLAVSAQTNPAAYAL